MASKFAGLLDSVRGEQSEAEATESKLAKPQKIIKPRKAKIKTTAVKSLAAPAKPDTFARRGRPPAKHSDPSFQQVTAYVKRDTYKQIKIALLQSSDGQEFSELVEQLLAGWLKERRGRK